MLEPPSTKESDLTFDLSLRMNLVEQLKSVVEKMGKTVTVKYY